MAKWHKKSPTKLKTVGEAILDYIRSKENILSPSSVRGYYIIFNNCIESISYIKLSEIDEKALQAWVNANSTNYAPKSVKSQYSLVSSALRQNKIKLDYGSVLLPRIVKKEPVIPDEEQIGQILHMVEGTSVELPVTMAVILGMRQSEIAGLKWSDYDGNSIYIHGSIVPNKENKYIYKNTTKSNASTRLISVDGILKERLDRAERKSEFISPMLPSSVLRKFNHLCDKNGLPRFTMHSQRHANASVMLANGVPDKYAMARLGQSSPSMVKNVYQHLYEDKEKQYATEILEKFNDLAK